MPGPITWLLMGLTVGAVVAEVWAVRRWRLGLRAAGGGGDESRSTAVEPLGWGPAGLIGAIGVGALVALGVETATVGDWRPLASHLHGLLMMSVLLAGAIVFLRLRTRLGGLTLLAMPVLAFFLLWSVCASWWTARLFELDAVARAWSWVHLSGVYGGTTAAVLAAASGGAYLWAQRSLRAGVAAPKAMGLASLERLERWTADTAAVGVVLRTLGLASGLVIYADTPGALGTGPWVWLKVGLATTAWAAYAAAMCARRSAVLRGSRGAWLAIAGLVLLVVVYAIVVSLPAGPAGGAA